MVEVFKTNVRTQQQAERLLEYIHTAMPAYRANFDLEDCDNILRIETALKPIRTESLIRLVRD